MNSTKNLTKQRRQFFLGLSLILAILSIFSKKREILASLALVFLLTELFIPPLSQLLFRGWLFISKILAKFNTTLIVSIIYMCLFVPVGFFLRLFKNSSTPNTSKKTNWFDLTEHESYSNPY